MKRRITGPFYGRYSPEWGGGGLYGLSHNNGVVIYTIAFDARTIICDRDFELIKEYNYELIGPPPRSGGDTYGAVEWVDESIYFGGWVHAPVNLDTENLKITFKNKYSHVHEYNLASNEISLLYKDGPGSTDEWRAEVSDIIYDPVNDVLYLFRGDGHFNHGIYELDRRGSSARRLSDTPVLRGCIFLDRLVSGIFNAPGFKQDSPTLLLLELNSSRRLSEANYSSASSADGMPITDTSIYSTATIRNELYAITSSGFFVGDPTGEYDWKPHSTFFRLFSTYGVRGYALAKRVKPITYCGGLLLPVTKLDVRETPSMGFGPSGLLLFIDEGFAKIVYAGGRVTGLTSTVDGILVGSASAENMSRTTKVDLCNKDLVKLPPEVILARPPPVTMILSRGIKAGYPLGGVPLTGYVDKKLIIEAARPNYLEIHEYSPLYGFTSGKPEKVRIKPGRNVVELDGYSMIVSFSFRRDDGKASVYISLA